MKHADWKRSESVLLETEHDSFQLSVKLRLLRMEYKLDLIISALKIKEE